MQETPPWEQQVPAPPLPQPAPPSHRQVPLQQSAPRTHGSKVMPHWQVPLQRLVQQSAGLAQVAAVERQQAATPPGAPHSPPQHAESLAHVAAAAAQPLLLEVAAVEPLAPPVLLAPEVELELPPDAQGVAAQTPAMAPHGQQ